MDLSESSWVSVSKNSVGLWPLREPVPCTSPNIRKPGGRFLQFEEGDISEWTKRSTARHSQVTESTRSTIDDCRNTLSVSSQDCNKNGTVSHKQDENLQSKKIDQAADLTSNEQFRANISSVEESLSSLVLCGDSKAADLPAFGNNESAHATLVAASKPNIIFPRSYTSLERDHPHSPQWGEHPSRRLLLRNIKQYHSVESLQAIFECYGDIQTLDIEQLYTEGSLRLTYYDLRSSTSARRALSFGTALTNERLYVHYDPIDESQDNEGIVFICLEKSQNYAKAEVLKDVCMKFGELRCVTSQMVSLHYVTYLVEFFDIRHAIKAVEVLSHARLASYFVGVRLWHSNHWMPLEQAIVEAVRKIVDGQQPLRQNALWSTEASAHSGIASADLPPVAPRFPQSPSSPLSSSLYLPPHHQQQQQQQSPSMPALSPPLHHASRRSFPTPGSPLLPPSPTTYRSFSLPSLPQTSPQSPTCTSTNHMLMSPMSTCSSSLSVSPASPRQHAIPPEYEVNLDRILSGSDVRTTVMVRNIPNKYTQQMMFELVNETLRGHYDFFYLPIDFKNRCNVGYAFVNFIDSRSIIQLAQKLVGRKWDKFNSDKICQLSYARIQGKMSLIKHFRNSTLMMEEEDCRPKIFYSSGPSKGEHEPFPDPDKSMMVTQANGHSIEFSQLLESPSSSVSSSSSSHGSSPLSPGGYRRSRSEGYPSTSSSWKEKPLPRTASLLPSWSEERLERV